MKSIEQEIPYNSSWVNLVIILLLTTLFSCHEEGVPSLDTEECVDIPVAPDVYVYPVLPGTQEWIDIPSVAERVLACQVPDETLLEMSTEGLIGTWLTFPFAINVLASSTRQKGIEYSMKNFSGLQELCNRSDSGTELMKYYKRMQPSCMVSNPSSYPDGSLPFMYIELLLAQDVILNRFDVKDKKLLVAEALEKFEYKKINKEYFSVFYSAGYSLFICVRTMKNANYQPFIDELKLKNSTTLNNFINSGDLFLDDYSASEINMITMHSKNFIK